MLLEQKNTLLTVNIPNRLLYTIGKYLFYRLLCGFSGLPALRAQIARDVAAVTTLLC